VLTTPSTRTVYSTVVSIYTTSITESLKLTTLVDATATITTEVVMLPVLTILFILQLETHPKLGSNRDNLRDANKPLNVG
jgi:hypothetical protein